MVPTLCKKLRILVIALPLVALMLSMSPTHPLAKAGVPARTPRTAIICLIGSICVDVEIDVNV